MTAHQCLRGMRDIEPQDAQHLSYIENILREVAQKFGYQEIRFPILESSTLFEKSIGIETDVVGQEMYTFSDKNDSQVALRPEGTAGCLRSVLANGLIQRQRQKFFYLGQMFRRERPQKGRYREFTHFGVETYGFPSGLIDAELIVLSHAMWSQLNINIPALHINYLGSAQTRSKYRDALHEYWQLHLKDLTDAEQTRAEQNPLRLLDSKNPGLATHIANAPKITDYLTDQEHETYEQIKQTLTEANIAFIESSALVRGLDYYSDFIFEWISDELGAQSTVCGGGRYDALVTSMGVDVPATGFAIGIDRLSHITSPASSPLPSFYICGESQSDIDKHWHTLNQIRTNVKSSMFIDAVAKRVRNINHASTLGYTHTILLASDDVKVINHATSESSRQTLDALQQYIIEQE